MIYCLRNGKCYDDALWFCCTMPPFFYVDAHSQQSIVINRSKSRAASSTILRPPNQCFFNSLHRDIFLYDKRFRSTYIYNHRKTDVYFPFRIFIFITHKIIKKDWTIEQLNYHRFSIFFANVIEKILFLLELFVFRYSSLLNNKKESSFCLTIK